MLLQIAITLYVMVFVIGIKKGQLIYIYVYTFDDHERYASTLEITVSDCQRRCSVSVCCFTRISINCCSEW
jgi:hypothetical protein